jgi:hypothetical protein
MPDDGSDVNRNTLHSYYTFYAIYNCVVSEGASFYSYLWLALLTNYYSGDHITQDESGGKCGTYGREGKGHRGLVRP